MAYILCYALTGSILLYSEKIVKKKEKNLIGLFGLLPLLLLAAFRSNDIGTDIKWYTEPLFGIACESNSFNDFLSESWILPNYYVRYIKDIEIGFSALIYFVSKVFGNINVLYFFIELLILLPLYASLRLFRNKISLSFGIIVYCFMFYQMGFNLMRQMIAISFFLLSFSLMIKKKYVKSLLFFAISIVFHYSAFYFGILVFLIYILLNKDLKVYKKFKFITPSFSFFAIVVFSILFVILLNQLSFFWNLIGDYYSLYLKGDLQLEIYQIIIRLPILFIFIFERDNMQFYSIDSKFFIIAVFFDILLSQFSSITSQSSRMGYFFSIFYVFSLYLVCKDKNVRKRNILSGYVLAYVVMYWWYNYILNFRGETYPYQWIF